MLRRPRGWADAVKQVELLLSHRRLRLSPAGDPGNWYSLNWQAVIFLNYGCRGTYHAPRVRPQQEKGNRRDDDGPKIVLQAVSQTVTNPPTIATVIRIAKMRQHVQWVITFHRSSHRSSSEHKRSLQEKSRVTSPLSRNDRFMRCFLRCMRFGNSQTHGIRHDRCGEAASPAFQ